MKKQKILQDLRMYEDFTYNYKLDFLTKFNIINNLDHRKFLKISLNFGFKNINFDKKKMIPFFMILELISNQKSYINFSKKNVLSIKIKKGTITGCKVTLRNKNLYNFLDVLLLSLPRYENFKGFSLQNKNKKVNNVKINLLDLFVFHTIESELIDYIKHLDINFVFNTINNDEKIFLLTYNKIPIYLN
jgi:large subunit ribosomal protein L5